MKRILILLASFLAFMLTMLANAGAASASWWIYHEPKIPAKLRR